MRRINVIPVIKNGLTNEAIHLLSLKTTEPEGRQVKVRRFVLGEVCRNLSEDGGKLKAMSAQPGDDQRVVMLR